MTQRKQQTDFLPVTPHNPHPAPPIDLRGDVRQSAPAVTIEQDPSKWPAGALDRLYADILAAPPAHVDAAARKAIGLPVRQDTEYDKATRATCDAIQRREPPWDKIADDPLPVPAGMTDADLPDSGPVSPTSLAHARRHARHLLLGMNEDLRRDWDRRGLPHAPPVPDADVMAALDAPRDTERPLRPLSAVIDGAGRVRTLPASDPGDPIEACERAAATDWLRWWPDVRYALCAVGIVAAVVFGGWLLAAWWGGR